MGVAFSFQILSYALAALGLWRSLLGCLLRLDCTPVTSMSAALRATTRVILAFILLG